MAAIVSLAVLAVAPALAQVCAPPTNFTSGTLNGNINSYWGGNGNLAVNANSLTLGTLNAAGNTTTPSVGDLLIVMQMQDATIVTSNDSSYGAGTGSGTGSTAVRNSGLYEYVLVTAVAGSNITFLPKLTNSYTQDAANLRSYQVIRVPQYTTATAEGITAPPWDGSSGGVAALDVRDTLTLSTAGSPEAQAGRAFFVGGKGFRGGMGRAGTAASGFRTDYATAAGTATGTNFHGTKGEGIAGTPRYVAIYGSAWGEKQSPNTNPTITQVTATFHYTGGSGAQGAPANAGGGGSDGFLTTAQTGDNGTAGGQSNQYNAGGGGGGNYGPGGVGGKPWNWSLYDSGGRGGAGYAGTLAFNRVFLGGGGGSGGTNNFTNDTYAYTNNGIACGSATGNATGTAATPQGKCSSGAAGGGVVIIRARTLTGSGIIDARGANGYNVNNDSGGGGGAGGSIVLQTQQGSTGPVSILATGGDGGNAYGQSTGSGNRHGPGGGGGGGFAAYSPNSMAVNATVGGGVPGQSSGGDFYDANGYNGGLTTFQTPNVPGVVQAADCDPSLSLTKSNGVTSLNSPGTTTYTFTVVNSGSQVTSGTVTIGDQLPAGLSVVPGPLVPTGANAGSWSCSASVTTAIVCTSGSAISGGGTSTFAIVAAVSAANGTSLVNRARVTGGNDPNKVTPANPVTDAAACTATGTPAGCALDTDTVLAPNLSLTKTNGTDTIVRGTTFTYQLVVTNGGSTDTSATITVLDSLPAGLTYTSTPGGNLFTCSTSGTLMTCTRPTALGAGASATITFVAQALVNAPSAVTNLARVGGGGDPSPQKSTPVAASVTGCATPVPPATTSSDPSTGCAADTDSVRFVSLALSKDDGQAYMSAGGSISYTFIVTNTGTADSNGTITMVDVLPSLTMTFANPLAVGGPNAANWSCTRTSATVATCASAAVIPAGGTSSFILGVNITTTVAVLSQFTNKARVGGGGDAANTATFATTADVTACTTDGNPVGCALDLNTVQNAAQIRLAKFHPDPQASSPGNSITFSLVVSNNGGTTATRSTIDVVDVVPANLTVNSVTPAAGNPVFSCAVAGQVVSCRNGNSVTDTDSTTAVATYELAPGASKLIQVSVTVTGAATNSVINKAKASGTTDPQNSTRATQALASACVSTNSPTPGCAVDPVPLLADLKVTKLQRTGAGTLTDTLATPVTTGSTLQFVLTVVNAGPSQATAVQVIDTVPNNFTGVSWSCAAAGSASCGATTSGTGNAISFTSGVLPAAATLTVTVNATATSATGVGGVTNTVSIITPTGISDGTPTNDFASVNTRVGSANLGITKSNGGTVLGAGTTTTYTIVVNNAGDFPADGARLYDAVATGLSCTAPPTCVAAGSGTSCPPGLTVADLQKSTLPTGVSIPTFGPGGSLTLTYTCGVTATGQ